MEEDRVLIAKLYYESLWNELIQRIKLRDTSLYLYITAVATIGGIELSNPEHRQILLVIPFISLATALIIRNHHLLIGAIRCYLSQISLFLSGVTGAPPSFENSPMIVDLKERMESRAWSSGVPLALGTLLALWENRELAVTWDARWWSGLVVGCAALLSIWNAHTRRSEISKLKLPLHMEIQSEWKSPSGV